MIRTCLPVLMLLAAIALTQSPAAQAQVNRCTAADGTSVYTDRDCSALGAVERLPRDRGPAAQRSAYRGGCAHSVQQLVHELTAAIDARDVNRLAALYHWPGMSGRSGRSVMDRLDHIARHPVLDIVALASPGPVVADPQPQMVASLPAASAAPTRDRGPPVALRVHQAAGDGTAPSRTVFSLRQHLDCWWIAL